MASIPKGLKFGWKPDPLDIRDYTVKTPQVAGVFDFLFDIFKEKEQTDELPKKVDNTKYAPPVQNQGNLGSCVAHAVAGANEFLQIKKDGRHTQGSRLFLYWVARLIMEGRPPTEDTGTYLRAGAKALRRFGIPEETYYPYLVDKVNEEPKWWLGDLADDFSTIKSVRLDITGLSREKILYEIKKQMTLKLPIFWGTYLCNALKEQKTEGDIPMPARTTSLYNGHAMFSPATYDDDKVIVNAKNSLRKTKGAFKMENSWGLYGHKGFIWLPYDYVLSGLSSDIWCLVDVKAEEAGKYE